MNKRNELRLKKIEDKIRSNGFNKSELFKFRHFYRDIKNTFNEKITADVTLRSVIASFSNDSFSIVAIYIYISVFYLVVYSLLDDKTGVYFFASGILLAALAHITYNARKSNIHIMTEIKLIKLYLRSYFK